MAPLLAGPARPQFRPSHLEPKLKQQQLRAATVTKMGEENTCSTIWVLG